MKVKYVPNFSHTAGIVASCDGFALVKVRAPRLRTTDFRVETGRNRNLGIEKLNKE